MNVIAYNFSNVNLDVNEQTVGSEAKETSSVLNQEIPQDDSCPEKCFFQIVRGETSSYIEGVSMISERTVLNDDAGNELIYVYTIVGMILDENLSDKAVEKFVSVEVNTLLNRHREQDPYMMRKDRLVIGEGGCSLPLSMWQIADTITKLSRKVIDSFRLFLSVKNTGVVPLTEEQENLLRENCK